MKRLVFISISLLLLLVLIPGCFTSATITPVGQPSVIGDFSSNPSTINSGGTSTLVWNVTGADTVTIDQGIGMVNVAGTREVAPLTSTVYTITATNSAGTVTRSAVTTVSSVPASAPAAATLISNAATVALIPNNVKSNGWYLDSTIQPFANDNPISAYSITFKRGEESLTNSVFTYETPGLAEYRYYSVQSQQGASAQDIHTLGEILAYSVSNPSTQDAVATYSIRFVKSNVYVELGAINNYQELQTYAKLMIDRIE